MILSLSLALLVTVSGAIATYLYDEETSLGSRLCTGACIGLASFGLIGFVFASLLGLKPFSIFLTTLFTCAPFALFFVEDQRQIIQADVTAAVDRARQIIASPNLSDLGYAGFYVMVAILAWLTFDRAMIVKPEGIYTGVLNNFGDLPFHLSVISSFAFGNNYPPEDPTFAGVRFTYPFLTDFISAIFVRCGTSLRASMLIENILLAVAFVGVLHRWAWEMLRDRVAAILTPLLVLLNGGFGFALLFDFTSKNENGLFGVLTHLPPSFTVIPETAWRWGNAISSLIVPQRGILLGLPLAVIVFTQWWIATKPESEKAAEAEAGAASGAKKKQKNQQKSDWGAQKLSKESESSVDSFSSLLANPTARMVAAGIFAGLLPLTHAHSFVVV